MNNCTDKKILIELGKNLVEIKASTKNKRGYVKINLDDEDINSFFTNHTERVLNKPITKKIYLVMEKE